MKQFNKNGIRVVDVENSSEGENFARGFLYKNSDFKTVLFLSGGKTPKSLYDQLLAEDCLRYGAVGMIDERYGEAGHENSNANIMKGFKPFYPILNGKSLKETALQYDQTVRGLFDQFKKSIGILGVGSDGHTAGIPAVPPIAKEIIKDKYSMIKAYNVSLYDISIYHTTVDYGKRITMTFNALTKLDQIIILVFGEDKKEALRKMFGEGLVSEVPARFYLQPEIAPKVTLVTDQEVSSAF